MHPPDDRRHMVFTMRLEIHIGQRHDAIVVFNLVKRRPQQLIRINAVAGKPVFVSAQKTRWSPLQAFTLRILADKGQQCANGGLGNFT
jgi:hypothetical protein